MKEKLFSVTKSDLDITYFKCSKGAGGQHRDKTDSACRVVHRDSGAKGECQEFREQHKNREAAFRRMTATKEFQRWLKVETARKNGMQAKIEAEVDRQMRQVKVEVQKDGEWVSE